MRELENCLRRAAACSDDGEIRAEDLSLCGGFSPLRLQEILEQATEAALRATLRRHAGQAEPAARELGVSLAELREMARRFRLRLEGSS